MAVLGSTVDPRLGAVNPAAIQALSQAGAATGQMYQNLGGSIAGVMEDVKDRRTANKIYEALGKSIPNIAESSGFDSESLAGILESAKSSGLPALRQLQDTLTGFIKTGYDANRRTQDQAAVFDHNLEARQLDRQLSEKELEQLQGYRVTNQNDIQSHEESMAKSEQLFRVDMQTDAASQQTQERLGAEAFTTKERKATEKYNDFELAYKSELKKEETADLYSKMLYNQQEIDKARSKNDIKRATSIARNQKLLEEEFINRKSEKSKALTEKLKDASRIENPQKRNLSMQQITDEFRMNGLSVPNTERLVFSVSDLQRKLTNGSWTKDQIPPALRNVIEDRGNTSAEEQWGRFLLATQGQLVPKDMEANKTFMRDFRRQYDIEDGFFKRISTGVDLFVADAINKIDFLDIFVNDFDQQNAVLNRKFENLSTSTLPRTIDE